ncbi:MAG: lamin tail domain-containing protein [Patescibacteria group bacterium]
MFYKSFRFLIIFFVFTGGFFIFGKNSLAATSGDVVINEIMWMGSTASSADEWIELKNTTNSDIDLSGWTIDGAGTSGGAITITASYTIIPAHGYFLISNYSENNASSKLDVIPNLVTTNISLPNTQLLLILKDTTGAEIDRADDGSGPPLAGDNTNKYSMERNDAPGDGSLATSWHTATTSSGFDAGAIERGTPSSTTPPSPAPFCGDGSCDAGEDCDTCPADCPAPPPPTTEINHGDVVINEFVSDPADGEEWIELFNNKGADVNLTGWILEDGTGTITTLSGAIAANGFYVAELSSSKLNNSGDIIKLKKPDGTIINQVVYGDWDDGNVSDNAPKSNDPNSVARKTDGNDTENDLADFFVTTTLTKNSANIITAPPDETSGGGSTPTETTPSSPPSWPVGALLINEFVADPADGEVEWIEFYNPGSAVINLNNWTIEDGSETTTELSSSVGPLGFFVLEKLKGILNNSGDAIILKDPAGVIIDQISYGNWDDGDTSDNAPVADDPDSVARKTDGQNTTNDFNDFVITTPTRGTSNADGLQQNINGAYSHDIIVNEILPNPKGDDSDGEFIELKNIGTTSIDLTGWKIGDASSKRYTVKASDFTSITLKPKEFFVLYRKITNIALNNSGTESAKIFSPDGALIHSVEYSGTAEEEQSFSRGEGTDYFWTTTPTPGKENIITRENQIPTAVISAPSEAEIGEIINFDGSDSTDPDGDELIFSWSFGDSTEAADANVAHTYSRPGKYKIILNAKDATGATDTAEQYILITDQKNENGTIPPAEQLIFINEILPNPEGSDDTEWIEIKSIDIEPLDLSGWKLDDDEDGSRPYKIPDGTIISPGQFLIFKKSETKLAFNNTFDAARLLDLDGEIFFETSYDEVPEGASWARDESGNFEWTTHLTPGEENIFEFKEKATAKKLTFSSKKSTTFTSVTLEDVRNLELGDGMRVTGQVIVEPGVLGSQIFYIADPEGCPGIQIYMYSKNFPELKLGDLVEITGILAESGGEKRIKVSDQSDIKILENQAPALRTPIKLSEVEEGLEGCLVSAAGEVTEKSGSNVYFADDDGELKIYFKSTLPFEKPNFKVGDQIETVGIISQTKTGFRLLPRYENDIAITTTSLKNNLSLSDASGKSEKGNINFYLGAATGILGLTLVGIGIKSGTFENWWKKIKGV